ncbi:peptidoglycan D,D-transpeptidase FtsI family protein [Paenibacillus ginsengihumi]|uniref:peptidoglycan D,D-transpeptidase FtsI family protein n=1 Tax=Paenibacillus ginsengihumi TaxID=431596 RepID=UPI0003616428|nr:penicillin-binding transpeptidase domain-containing protein [Paenibacillus ginsengihumi]
MKNPLLTEDPNKDKGYGRRSFTVRVNVFFFATFALFSVLIVRLAMLQFVESPQLKEEEAQHLLKDTPIPPIRGNIFDRTGYPIAYTVSTQSLYFRVENGQKQDDVIALAYTLEDIFAKYGSPYVPQPAAADIMKAMDVGYGLDKNETAKKPGYSFVPRRIKAGLTPDEIAFILERRDELKWIEIMEESVRTYDDKHTIAVQLVGYMRTFSAAREPKNGLAFYQNPENTTGYLDTEDVGFDGIERAYQEALRGKNGYKTYPVNAQQRIVGNVMVQPPEKGHNLFLTIHKDVQLAAEQAIIDHLAYMKSAEARALKTPAIGRNAVAGYAVAIETETGKVVAMASMPDYDPNVWIGGIGSTEEYLRIQPYVNNGTITTAYPDYPPEERNRHPNSIVFLGSTIKPLSVLIGLKEGLITPSTRYNDTGKFTYGRDGSTLSNSGGTPFGWITPTQALRHSSNTFMSAMIGIPFHARYGDKAPDKWAEYLAEFGLGVSTGSGLPREYAGGNEFQTNTRETFQSRMVFASWGQNGKYTALQLAQYAATLANRGERLRPLLVDRIETYDGKVVQRFDQKEVLNRAEYADAHWDAVISGMESGIRGFEGFPYTLVRKTGTSTQSVGGREVDNAVFIAYAPKEKPKLAVAVVVPEGGFGAWGAAPIARQIFDAYDQAYGLGNPAK